MVWIIGPVFAMLSPERTHPRRTQKGPFLSQHITMPTLDYITSVTAQLKAKDGLVSVAGLEGSAPAYLLSRLIPEKGGPLLIVTADQESADELCRELRYFAARPEEILPFPS